MKHNTWTGAHLNLFTVESCLGRVLEKILRTKATKNNIDIFEAQTETESQSVLALPLAAAGTL